MIQKQNRGHEFAVAVLDSILLFIAFYFASSLWHTFFMEKPLSMDERFRQQFMLLFLAFWITKLFSGSDGLVIRKGLFDEFYTIVRHNFITLLIDTLIIFVFNQSDTVSRGTLAVTMIFSVILTGLVHMFLRFHLARRRNRSKSITQVLLVTTRDRLAEVVPHTEKYCAWNQRISGIIVVDENDEEVGKHYHGIPILGNFNNMFEVASRQIVDEVFIYVAYDTGASMRKYVQKFEEMGVSVHLYIQMLENYESTSHRVTNFAGYPVVTFSERFFSWGQLLVKRIIDILGALVGMIFLILATIILFIPLKLESPGPLFFKQKRVGKNGRYFTIYKFRSMYMDAEERKKELMAQNEMKGAMFKMTNDPRITKIGRFIRATSIDELPQFWNVLKGDMSLVGTRPPTIEEFKEYSPYHKRRLALKPGLSGLWQVSGRSDISDFEEVVKLDLQYIDNWSLALDIKIILKTILVVFTKRGSR